MSGRTCSRTDLVGKPGYPDCLVEERCPNPAADGSSFCDEHERRLDRTTRMSGRTCSRTDLVGKPGYPDCLVEERCPNPAADGSSFCDEHERAELRAEQEAVYQSGIRLR